MTTIDRPEQRVFLASMCDCPTDRKARPQAGSSPLEKCTGLVESMRLVVVLISGMLTLGDSLAQATLPTVDVIDTGTGPSYNFYPWPSLWEQQTRWGITATYAQGQIANATDVRCAAIGDARNTTSLADQTTRWLAAEQVYRFTKQTISIWGRFVGKNPLHGGKITVTYADGGRETWLIVSPGLSTALSPTPVESKSGDGMIKPHPACKIGMG